MIYRLRVIDSEAWQMRSQIRQKLRIFGAGVRAQVIVDLVRQHFSSEYELEGFYVVAGWTSIMVVVLMLGGIQMLMLGIIGKYLWQTSESARRQKLYIVEDRVGFVDVRRIADKAVDDVRLQVPVE